MRSDVIDRRLRVVVVILMATDATGVRNVVVAVDVAVGALPRRHGVHSSQRPSGCGVIEGAVHPVDSVVALLASCGEVCPDVVNRRLRVVVVILMATDASCVCDVVVIVDVAIGALTRRHGVLSGQREAGLRVVKARRRPTAGGVAHLASLREVLLRVVGIVRSLVVLQVARDARGIGDVVVVIGVAIGALARRHGVQAGQRERGLRVDKIRRLPSICSVARFAGLGEAQLHMIRVCRSGEVLQVARYARGDGQVVVVVDMAIGALARRHGMRSGEREARGGVVKPGIEPVVEAVALFAGRGELVDHMIRIRSCAKVGRMATVAIGGHRAVLADRLVLVTRGAIHCGVRSQQRKPVLVLLDLRDLYGPTLDGVALFAIGSQLALVNIGMAIGTSCSGIGKYRFDMALRTGYRFMPSAQR